MVLESSESDASVYKVQWQIAQKIPGPKDTEMEIGQGTGATSNRSLLSQGIFILFAQVPCWWCVVYSVSELTFGIMSSDVVYFGGRLFNRLFLQV